MTGFLEPTVCPPERHGVYLNVFPTLLGSKLSFANFSPHITHISIAAWPVSEQFTNPNFKKNNNNINPLYTALLRISAFSSLGPLFRRLAHVQHKIK